MDKTRSTLTALTLALALVPAAAVAATNLIANGGFDANLGGWTSSALAPHSIHWDPIDAVGNPGSGSLRMSDLPTDAISVVSSVCFPVTPGSTLVFGASAWGPDDHTHAALFTQLRLYDDASCVGSGSLGADLQLFARSGRSGWGPTQASRLVPAGIQAARLTLRTTADTGDVYFDNVFVFEEATCAGTADVLCLADGRFRVTAEWHKPDGSDWYARVRPLTGDSGYLWFQQPTNVEIVLKVLDACGFADRFWVFAAGLTNLEAELLVTDTETGETWAYDNPPKTPFPPVQDTAAFETCP